MSAILLLPAGVMPAKATSAQIRARIAKIFEECASPLGWACRGVASWEADQLREIIERYPAPLTGAELHLLARVELQVFGAGA